MKQKLALTSGQDRTGATAYTLSKPKGGNLTLAEIKNFLVESYGGGVYLAVINANDGMLTDKISSVELYDACDILP